MPIEDFPEWFRTFAVLVPINLGFEHYAGWQTEPEHVGDLYWWHPCTKGSGLGQVDLTSGERHSLITANPLTVQGSLLCTGCGDHGWIRDGKWEQA